MHIGCRWHTCGRVFRVRTKLFSGMGSADAFALTLLSCVSLHTSSPGWVKLATKNFIRIEALEPSDCHVYKFYSWGFYGFLVGVIAFGAIAKRGTSPAFDEETFSGSKCIQIGLDFFVGMALLVSGCIGYSECPWFNRPSQYSRGNQDGGYNKLAAHV